MAQQIGNILAKHWLRKENLLDIEREAFHTSEPESTTPKTEIDHKAQMMRAGKPDSVKFAKGIFFLTHFNLYGK